MVKVKLTELFNTMKDGNESDGAYDVTERSKERIPNSPQDNAKLTVKRIQTQLSRGQAFFPKQERVSLMNRSCQADVDNFCNYDMTSFPRGVMLIFNISEFDVTTGLQDYPRIGSEIDSNTLKDVFLELGFVVYIYNDVSKKEMFEAIEELSLRYSTLSCFSCAILSHGDKGHFYAKDQIVKYSDAFSILESQFWVGKPKLFFLQSCLGVKHMDSLTPDGLDEVDSPLKANDSLIPLPRHSDFFYAYSTVPGYSAWRNTHHGSWFIQELCKAFRDYSHKLDLSRIMTRANAAIALRVTETDDEETNNKRQIASTVSQLRKDLYFIPVHLETEHSRKAYISHETFL